MYEILAIRKYNGFVGGGYLNAANGSGATVLAGVYNTAYQSYSTVIGNRGKTRWQGHIVFGATNDSVMGYNGGQQCGLTSYNKQTTDATPTAIGTASAYSADTSRSVTMRSNTMFGFTITLVAGTQYWYSWVTTNSLGSPGLRAEDKTNCSYVTGQTNSLGGTDYAVYFACTSETDNTSPSSITASGIVGSGNTGGAARIAIKM